MVLRIVPGSVIICMTVGRVAKEFEELSRRGAE
jgi:hypothetical protein